jgi:hypothetical protein
MIFEPALARPHVFQDGAVVQLDWFAVQALPVLAVVQSDYHSPVLLEGKTQVAQFAKAQGLPANLEHDRIGVKEIEPPRIDPARGNLGWRQLHRHDLALISACKNIHWLPPDYL